MMEARSPHTEQSGLAEELHPAATISHRSDNIQAPVLWRDNSEVYFRSQKHQGPVAHRLIIYFYCSPFQDTPSLVLLSHSWASLPNEIPEPTSWSQVLLSEKRELALKL